MRLRLFLEQVMEAAIAARRRCRLIPRRQQLVPFGVGQQRQVGERGLGCGHDRVQQRPEMAGHARDARLVEQVGVVLPRRRRARAPIPRGRGSGRTSPSASSTCSGADRQARPRVRRPVVRQVLEGEHHLEERRCGADRARGAAPRPVSRTAGPDARRRRGRSCAPAGAPRGTRGSPDRSARMTRVLAKKPIRPSVSARRPVGDRRAHHDVVLPRVAVQQRLEGREQRHERRRVCPAGPTPSAAPSTRRGSPWRSWRPGTSGCRDADGRRAVRVPGACRRAAASSTRAGASSTSPCSRSRCQTAKSAY